MRKNAKGALATTLTWILKPWNIPEFNALMNLLNASLRHRYVIILDNSFHTLECRRFEDSTSSSFAALTMHLRVAESTQKQSTSKDDWKMKTKILSRPWKIIVGLDQTFSIIMHKDWENNFIVCVWLWLHFRYL